MNENNTIKEFEAQAYNTKYLMDRMNKAVYGMTWEERDRLFLGRSDDNSEKERKNEA